MRFIHFLLLLILIESTSNKFTLFSLENPFTMTNTLSKKSEVVLRLYDISGREIETLIKGTQSAGFKKITWNGTDSFNRPVSSGVYILRLETDNQVMSRKMMLIR